MHPPAPTPVLPSAPGNTDLLSPQLDYKEDRVLKNWCFQTVELKKTLESPLDGKEIKPVNPKEINPEYSLKGLMLKLQLHYFGHLMRRANSLEKTDTGKNRR